MRKSSPGGVGNFYIPLCIFGFLSFVLLTGNVQQRMLYAKALFINSTTIVEFYV